MRRVVYSVLLFTLLNLNSNVISAAQACRLKSLGCGAHNLSPGEYWIGSPRHMNQSKTAYNCQYSIMVSPKSMISITCPRFSTSSRWCRQNYLQIHAWKYCGQNKPKDVNRQGQLKIIAFSRGHPEKIKFLCQIVVGPGRDDASTSFAVASTSISTVTTALTQAPKTAASKSTVGAAVPTTSSTAVSMTTAAPTSYIASETSTFETTVSSTATPSLTTDTTTVSTTTPACQPQPPAPVKCGMANNRKARIVGGEAAERNEFPWLAAVVETGKSEARWVATILNSLYVILPSTYTVIRDIDKLEVVVHKHFTSADKQQIRIKIKSAVKDNDVMLLKLRTPIVFPANNSIAPVCLPSEDRTDYAGEQGILAGWGWTAESVWSPPKALMKIMVTVASGAECKATVEQYSKYAKFNATTKLCTVLEKGKGACAYDSGAPLITADNDGKYSIIGMSHIDSCGEKTGLPDIYHKITFHLPWIRRQIADGEYCTKT